MSLVTSLLTAIVRADGDALVMHVGDKPYVVTSSGSIELSTSDLNLEAMSGMVGQLLPPDALRALSEFGAVEHHLTPAKEFRDQFTVVAARGGDDVWIEIRRKRTGLPAMPQPVPAMAPEPVREPAPAPEREPVPVTVAAAPQPVAPVVPVAPVPHIAPAAPVPHVAPAAPVPHIAPAAHAAPAAPVQHTASVTSASARQESQTSEPPSLATDSESFPPSLAQNPEASFGEAIGEAGIEISPERPAPESPEAGPIVPVQHSAPVLAAAPVEHAESVTPVPAPSLTTNAAAAEREPVPVTVAAAPPQPVVPIVPVAPVPHIPPAAAVPHSAPAAHAAPAAPVQHMASVTSASARRESQTSDPPSLAEGSESLLPSLAQTRGASFPPSLAQSPGASFGEASGEPGGEAGVATSAKRPILESREGVSVAPAPAHVPSLTNSENVGEAGGEASRTAPDAPIAYVAPVVHRAPAAVAAAREESPASYPPSLTGNAESLPPSLAQHPDESFPPPLAQNSDASFPPSLAQSPGASFGEASGVAVGDPRGDSLGEARGEISANRPALESRDARPVAPGVVLPMTRTLRIEVPSRTATGRHADAERLLSIAAARGASVLYLTSQSRPFLKVEGDIRPIENEPPLASADVEAAVLELMPETARDAHSRGEPAEWVSEFEGIGRIRCTAFRDYRGAGAVFHLISARPISAEQLGLAREVQALATESDGLVLVASPRGSGRSTVVSALVDVINRQHSAYVITLERQIRIVHENRHSLITQREVRGTAGDVVALARTALRENPDVLVIEDLMSPDVIQLALDAAGSGLLVFLSVTAGSTISALVRLIELFPPDRRKAVQAALAERLRGAVAQVLLWKTGGGRVAARELLLTTSAVAGLIADGRIAQLAVAMDSGRKVGMVSLNDALMAFVQNGAVDVREAYRKADDRAALLALLKRTGLDTSFAERLA